MIKFDLERALVGDKVITRDGREVTQLTHFNAKISYPLIGVVDGGLESWRGSGKSTDNGISDVDLFMAPKKLSGFVCVYMNSEGLRYTNSFDRVEQADLYVSKGHKEAARIDLSQFEEGHGL